MYGLSKIPSYMAQTHRKINNMAEISPFCIFKYKVIYVKEVPVKWIDRPSSTEMEKGHSSEMDRQTKCHKNENVTEMNKIL